MTCNIEVVKYRHRHETPGRYSSEPPMSYLRDHAIYEIAHTLDRAGLIETEHWSEEWSRERFTEWTLKAVPPGCRAKVAEPGYTYLHRAEPLRKRWGAWWVALRGLVKDTWREAWRFT